MKYLKKIMKYIKTICIKHCIENLIMRSTCKNFLWKGKWLDLFIVINIAIFFSRFIDSEIIVISLFINWIQKYDIFLATHMIAFLLTAICNHAKMFFTLKKYTTKNYNLKTFDHALSYFADWLPCDFQYVRG